MNMTFRRATADDWHAMARLLTRVDLPLDGAEAHIDNFLIVCNGGG